MHLCVRASTRLVQVERGRHRMFGLLGRAFRTKVGIALIGALLVGGGGTAMAMATSTGHTPFGSSLSSTASSGHSDEAGKTPGATKSADQGDQDDQGCTSSASGTPGAHSD